MKAYGPSGPSSRRRNCVSGGTSSPLVPLERSAGEGRAGGGAGMTGVRKKACSEKAAACGGREAARKGARRSWGAGRRGGGRKARAGGGAGRARGRERGAPGGGHPPELAARAGEEALAAQGGGELDAVEGRGGLLRVGCEEDAAIAARRRRRRGDRGQEKWCEARHDGTRENSPRRAAARRQQPAVCAMALRPPVDRLRSTLGAATSMAFRGPKRRIAARSCQAGASKQLANAETQALVGGKPVAHASSCAQGKQRLLAASYKHAQAPSRTPCATAPN